MLNLIVWNRELFDHLTVCKQMTNVLIEFLVMQSNTWKYLSLFTNVYKSYISNVYV